MIYGSLFQLCDIPQVANICGLPGVARRLVTFFVLPKKVTKKVALQSAIPAGFPVLLGGGRGEIMKYASDKFNFVIPASAGMTNR